MKKCGRDEPIWIVIHMRVEATLGISLYSCLYLKLAKNAMFFLLSLMFSLQQNQRTRGQNRICRKWGGGNRECPNNVYTCE
jgi:hypothetical protein